MNSTCPAAGAEVHSDPGLLADIRRYGPFDTAGCYQCGTCTLRCDLAEGGTGFPRRTMRYALLGLQTPLTASLGPWLCHDCGDCSRSCPRQADPRHSMGTLRHYLIAQYDWTGLACRILTSPAWHFAALGLVAALVLALIVGYHLGKTGMSLSGFAGTSMGLEHMFPMMTTVTRVVVLLPVLLLASHACRMWRAAMQGGNRKVEPRHYLAELKIFLLQSASQRRMRDCEDPSRWRGHWMLACGTALMFVLVLFFLRWFQTDRIVAVLHPQRWLGYLATGLMLFGSGDAILRRLRKDGDAAQGWLQAPILPALLFLTALSGLVVHVLRYAGLPLAAHYAYALHIIVTVPMLLIEIPFGGWAHMVYRPFALFLQAVQERAAAEAPIGETVPNV